ncbi:MAG: lysophospholipid acyltransferase family protein [bacterium]|nr:lysophospholipid acyltransferase family protein [bacterium]
MQAPKSTESGRDMDWPVEYQAVHGTRNSLMAHVENFAWRITLGCLSRLPRPMLNAFGFCFAPLAKVLDRRHANSARAFLRQAFGEDIEPRELERRVTQAYRHLLEVAVTPARCEVRGVRGRQALLSRTEVTLSDEVRKVMEAGGLIVVSGHIGDWEMAASISSAVGFRPFYAISKPPRNRPMSIDAQRQREAREVRLLPRRGAMTFAPKVITGGGTLGMLLDQRARKKPVLAPYFGRLARSDRSAGVLLRRLKSPVVFLAVYRTGDLRWRLDADRVLFPSDIVGKSPEEVAALINVELERQVLEAPDQYFWLHDRYRKLP